MIHRFPGRWTDIDLFSEGSCIILFCKQSSCMNVSFAHKKMSCNESNKPQFSFCLLMNMYTFHMYKYTSYTRSVCLQINETPSASWKQKLKTPCILLTAPCELYYLLRIQLVGDVVGLLKLIHRQSLQNRFIRISLHFAVSYRTIFSKKKKTANKLTLENYTPLLISFTQKLFLFPSLICKSHKQSNNLQLLVSYRLIVQCHSDGQFSASRYSKESIICSLIGLSSSWSLVVMNLIVETSYCILSYQMNLTVETSYLASLNEPYFLDFLSYLILSH